MFPKLFETSISNLTLIALFLANLWHTTAQQTTANTYQIDTTYTGASFFNDWDFFTGADPTNGFVDYLSYSDALELGYAYPDYIGDAAYMGVDSTSTLTYPGVGRKSVRIASQKSWTHGLIISDIVHQPGGICGTWPAHWTLGPNWPYNGEIDIIEGVNSAQQNLMSLHTSPNCTIPAETSQLGVQESSNCDTSVNYNSGCNFASESTATYGSGFNSIGGGVFATEWTSSGITIWFFPRSSIPQNILDGTPDPSTWSAPQAIFPGGSNCDIDSHFAEHQIIFDTTFCGDYGDAVWNSDATCSSLASSCEAYVAGNPSAFEDAYWLVNSVKVYTVAPAPSATSTAGPSTGQSVSTSISISTSTAGPSTEQSVSTSMSISTSTAGPSTGQSVSTSMSIPTSIGISTSTQSITSAESITTSSPLPVSTANIFTSSSSPISSSTPSSSEVSASTSTTTPTPSVTSGVSTHVSTTSDILSSSSTISETSTHVSSSSTLSFSNVTSSTSTQTSPTDMLSSLSFSSVTSGISSQTSTVSILSSLSLSASTSAVASSNSSVSASRVTTSASVTFNVSASITQSSAITNLTRPSELDVYSFHPSTLTVATSLPMAVSAGEGRTESTDINPTSQSTSIATYSFNASLFTEATSLPMTTSARDELTESLTESTVIDPISQFTSIAPYSSNVSLFTGATSLSLAISSVEGRTESTDMKLTSQSTSATAYSFNASLFTEATSLPIAVSAGQGRPDVSGINSASQPTSAANDPIPALSTILVNPYLNTTSISPQSVLTNSTSTASNQTPTSASLSPTNYNCILYSPSFIQIFISPEMTHSLCANACRQRYIGLFNNECFCASDLETPTYFPDGDCNILCPGNNAEKCGGFRGRMRKRDEVEDGVLLSIFELQVEEGAGSDGGVSHVGQNLGNQDGGGEGGNDGSIVAIEIQWDFGGVTKKCPSGTRFDGNNCVSDAVATRVCVDCSVKGSVALTTALAVAVPTESIGRSCRWNRKA